MAISLPALAVGRVSAQVARGLQVIRYDLYTQGTIATAIMIAGLFAGHALGLGATTPAVAMALGTIAGGSAAWWLTSRLIARMETAGPAVDSGAGKGLIQFSLPIAAIQIVDGLAMRADVLLLGMFANGAAGITPLTLGIYGAAWEAAGALRKFRQVFGLALTPAAARARSEQVETSTRDQAGQVGRWLVTIIGPAVCVMILGSSAILPLYGSGFEAGASWMSVLAIATGARGILVALDSRLIVDKPALNLLNGAVAVSLQAAVSILLIPWLGPLGAAIAALVATSVRALMLIVEIRIIEGWWWPLLSSGRPAIATAVALVPGVVTRLAWPGSTGACVAAIIFLISYLGMWKFVRLSADDRTLIRTIQAAARAPAEATDPGSALSAARDRDHVPLTRGHG
jgi:O-antigen/teichoic acid export membrane protein